MCELKDIKRSLNKEMKEIELKRQIKLINELGEPAHKFRIVDEMPMTHQLIQDFDLEIKTGVPGRPPKKDQ